MAKGYHCVGGKSHKLECPGDCGAPIGCYPQWTKEDLAARRSELGPIPHDTGDRMRKDDGKPRFDLLPPEPLFALSELYAFGAKKYAARGWEEGMHWGRCFGALMRHAWKFWRGEDFDVETGAHHMIAVAWNAFAIYTYFVRKVGTDDRGAL